MFMARAIDRKMRSATFSHRFLVLFIRYSTLLLLLTKLPCYTCQEENDNKSNNVYTKNNNDATKGTKIAVIGGGIGGSFATKYLSDYDTRHKSCIIDSIVVFDPSTILQQETKDDKQTSKIPTSGLLEENYQGSRVTSITLDDGTIAELGGSIIFDGNRLAVEMMEGDADNKLKRNTKGGDIARMPQGFGVYDGEKNFLLLASGTSSLKRKMKLLWRYNIDLIKISRAAKQSLPFFYSIYDMLENEDDPSTYFTSVDEMWNATGGDFFEFSRMSFDDLLDKFGLARKLPWWRKILPDQGTFRRELSTAMNLCNNNQPNSQMNGLSGFVNFYSTTGRIFSIEGGNNQLIQSALLQAKAKYDDAGCNYGDDSSSNERISHVQKKVTKVISDSEQMELWSGEENLGRFDVVILAAPLKFSQISFLTKHHLDEDNDDDDDKADLEPMFKQTTGDDSGAETAAHLLPPSTALKYTQVITTVVSNATLQTKYFGLEEKNVPRSIYVTERGRELEGVTALSHLGVDKVYKIFSVEKLSEEKLKSFFGPYHKVEYVKVWGGNHGGATPNYNGGGVSALSTPYLLYGGEQQNADSRTGFPVLYYINSVEPTVSVIELSAIGAKSVAKLVAQRLGLLMPTPSNIEHEEL